MRPLIVGVYSLCVVGMAVSAVPVLPKQWLNKAAAMQWLAAHPDEARFVSRGGQIQGGDSDAVVVLTQPDKVEMTEFGAGIGTFKGTYDINDAGEITLHLEGYGGKWPVMRLYTTARDAWLMRTDMKTGFGSGGNNGSSNSDTPFWPFKWKKRA